MRITYTGRQVEMTPAQLRKLEAQCAKVGKLLDSRKSECEARVVLSTERHLHKVEVTVKYHDHSLIGLAEDADLFTAVHGAIGKLEKQAIKVRAKWRDSKRVPRKENAVVAAAPPPEPPAKTNGKAKVAAKPPNPKTHGKNGSKARVHVVDGEDQRQSLTLEEAIAEMGRDRDHLTFLDSKTGAVNVLVRRRDGHLDLVEA